MLRQLADAGRVIVVVTHSLTFLDDCDQVLLLAPGGKTAFCGPPDELATGDGSHRLGRHLHDRQRRSRRRAAAVPRRQSRAGPRSRARLESLSDRPAQTATPARTSVWRQISTIARRQVRLLMADRGYLAFLAVLPFIVGLLPLTVAGHAGFGHPPSDGSAPFEPKHLIALTSFAAILMGTTLTVRDLVGERAIFRREQAAGLSASAYLLAKIAVFGAVAVIQSAILVLVVTAPAIGKPAPVGRGGAGQPDVGVVRRCRGDVRGCGRTGTCGFGAGADQRSGHRAAGGGADGATGARRRIHPGDGPAAARDHRLAHARAVGFRGHRIDGRSDQSRRRNRATMRIGSTPRRRGSSTWPCWECWPSSSPASRGGGSGSRL